MHRAQLNRDVPGRLQGALGLSVAARRGRFEGLAGRVQPGALLALLRARGERLADRGAALVLAVGRGADRRGERLTGWDARLTAAHQRALSVAVRLGGEGRARLSALSVRLDVAPAARLQALAERLDRLDRLRQTLGHAETLKRGFAIVRGDGAVVTTRAAAERAQIIEIEFQDGRLQPAAARGTRRGKGGGDGGQGKLF